VETRSMPLTARLIVFSVIASLLLCACTNRKKSGFNEQLARAFNESDATILQSTTIILKSLEDLKDDPVITYRAAPWFEKAVSIDSLTRTLIVKIDSAINNKITLTDIIQINDSIEAYKKVLLKTDTEIVGMLSMQFNDICKFFSLAGRDSSGTNSSWKQVLSNDEAILFLAALKNKVRILENKLVQFCHVKVPAYDDGFGFYNLIIGQNAKILAPGSKLEINAGVGAFSKAALPEVSIRNKIIPLNEEGYARYIHKVPDTPGEYEILVRVSFINLITGKNEIQERKIKFKVVKPCE
jgi:hypothetical protein